MVKPIQTTKRQLHRMVLNRKRRNEMKRTFITARASQTGWHVSVYNVPAFVERHGIKPPFTFELSPINYDKLWREQREYKRDIKKSC